MAKEYLEQRMSKRFLRSIDLWECFKAPYQTDKHKSDSGCNDCKICSNFFASQDILNLSDEQQIVQAEITAEQDQEN